MILYTARVSYRGPDRLDVTRKSAPPEGLPFAPSWTILRPALVARDLAEGHRRRGAEDTAQVIEKTAWDTYVPAYQEEMQRSYRTQRPAWDALLAREEVTLCCYCTDPARCHRTLLAAILVKLGAMYKGER